MDLLIYCINNDNNYFLRQALLLAAFDKMLFRDDQVIGHILDILKKGYSTVFILNILSLIDISVWKNNRLKQLIQSINCYALNDYPNPLLSITLACEILSKVAKARRKFESECFQIQQNLLKLGNMYSKKITDENYYESLIMSTDFNDRNVVKIITMNNFEQLMSVNDPKAERVMLMIWQGKEAALCDGDILGYSSVVHVLLTFSKQISDRNRESLM